MPQGLSEWTGVSRRPGGAAGWPELLAADGLSQRSLL